MHLRPLPPPPPFDPAPRLVASAVAGLLVVNGTDHPLVAAAVLFAALAAIWGCP